MRLGAKRAATGIFSNSEAIAKRAIQEDENERYGETSSVSDD
jgi:hypothetical protein